jgi:uncharacterized protein (DUF2384 family)
MADLKAEGDALPQPPPARNPLADLMVLARLRRMLLELGIELALDRHDGTAGALELWMHQPRPELEGQTPLVAMQDEVGAEKVRACLRSLADGTQNPDLPKT